MTTLFSLSTRQDVVRVSLRLSVLLGCYLCRDTSWWRVMVSWRWWMLIRLWCIISSRWILVPDWWVSHLGLVVSIDWRLVVLSGNHRCSRTCWWLTLLFLPLRTTSLLTCTFSHPTVWMRISSAHLGFCVLRVDWPVWRPNRIRLGLRGTQWQHQPDSSWVASSYPDQVPGSLPISWPASMCTRPCHIVSSTWQPPPTCSGSCTSPLHFSMHLLLYSVAQRVSSSPPCAVFAPLSNASIWADCSWTLIPVGSCSHTAHIFCTWQWLGHTPLRWYTSSQLILVSTPTRIFWLASRRDSWFSLQASSPLPLSMLVPIYQPRHTFKRHRQGVRLWGSISQRSRTVGWLSSAWRSVCSMAWRPKEFGGSEVEWPCSSLLRKLRLRWLFGPCRPRCSG